MEKKAELSTKSSTKSADAIPESSVYQPSYAGAAGGAASRAKRAFGYLARMLVAYAAALSLTLMLCDAFFPDISAAKTALITALFCCFFGAMCVGSLLRRIGEGIILLAVSAYFLVPYVLPDFALKYGDGYTVVYAFCRLWNMAMARLEESGFRVFFTLTYESPLDGDTLALIGISIVAALLSLIFCVCLCRKTRLAAMLAAGAVVESAVFTYNIAENNWYFALMLSALCGILALKLYDRFYLPAAESGAQKKSASSLGGYVGFAAVLLSFALLAIPASTITKRWETIEFIDYKLEYLRAVTSSLIVGEAPNQGDLGYLGNLDTLNSRDTEAEARSFTGKEILQVQASYPYPVYLRSWAGMYYSDDKWYSALTEDVDYYKGLFGDDFTPEDITYNFYSVVNPSLLRFTNISSYQNHIEDGFMTMTVDVKNLASSGNLLFMPTFTDPEIGLLEYGAEDVSIPYSSDYKNYHDGIVTTSWLNFNKQYRAITFVPSYRNADYGDVINGYRAYYSMIMYIIRMYDNGYYDGMSDDEVTAQADSMLQYYEETYGFAKQTTVERFLAMTDAEQEAFLYENYSLPQKYKEYVYKYYTGGSGSAAVKEVAAEVTQTLTEEYFSDIGGANTDYAAMLREQLPYVTVLSVIDWLGDHCVYTLTPKTSSTMSPVDAFLTKTNEGYCVQFATSAALILRELGFPVRYVEGYLASDYQRDADPDRINRYITTVRDYDAHAWIEVYFDGVGWMQFETTPAYYDDMYEAYVPSEYTAPDSTGYDTMREETVSEDDDTPAAAKKQDYGPLLIMLAVVVGGIGIIVAAVLLIRGYVTGYRLAAQKRDDTIEKALEAGLDDDDVRRLGGLISRYIMETLACVKITPATGELPSEFAARAETELEKLKASKKKATTLEERLTSGEAAEETLFPEIMERIEAETYGGAMTPDDLNKCAKYLVELRKTVKGLLSPVSLYVNGRIKRRI